VSGSEHMYSSQQQRALAPLSEPSTRGQQSSWKAPRCGGGGAITPTGASHSTRAPHREDVDWRTSTLPAVPLRHTGTAPKPMQRRASTSFGILPPPDRTAKMSQALLASMGNTGRAMILRFHARPSRATESFSVEAAVLRRGAVALDLGKQPTASTATLLSMMQESKIPPVHHDRIHAAAPLGRAGFHRIALKSQGTTAANAFNDTLGFGATLGSVGGGGYAPDPGGFNDTLESTSWAEETTVYDIAHDRTNPQPMFDASRASYAPPAAYRPMTVEERDHYDDVWNDPDANYEWRWLQHPDQTFLSQYIGLEHKDLNDTTTSLPPPLRLMDIRGRGAVSPGDRSTSPAPCGRGEGDTTIGPSKQAKHQARRRAMRRVWRATNIPPAEERRRLRREVALAMPVPDRIQQLATPVEHEVHSTPTVNGSPTAPKTHFQQYKASQRAAKRTAEAERELCRQIHLPVFLHSKELL
jgi:hypothetical protein